MVAPNSFFQRLIGLMVAGLVVSMMGKAQTTTALIAERAISYYVSATGSNSNDGKSQTTPFQTIQKAADLTVAGDTVFIMNGTYSSTSGPLLTITRSGTASGFITFKALKGHTPKITASGNVWNAVTINGSYVVFQGVELVGNNANITYEAAFKAYTDYVNGVAGPNANFNTNGISIGGPGMESKFPHHITIRECRVHNFPGGGISSIQADYTTIEKNVVYNNAWYMMYGGSGISILNPYNSDKLTTYKNIIRDNICNTNKTTIPWVSQKKLSDGNGIIVDVNQHPYGVSTGEAYTGRTLVENNVSTNNGGSGIHSFLADHVDIINNTAYNNGTVVGYAEIFSNQCQDVNIINNIMYARTGGDCNTKPKNASEVYSYNLYFNGKVAVQGSNDVIANPEFLNLSTDLTIADFRLKKESPAIDQGSDLPGQFSLTDILGTVRPQGARPDKGAYEFSNAVITELNSPVTSEAPALFPNPVEETLLVQLPASQKGDYQLAILATNGSVMSRHLLKSPANAIPVAHLSAGLYIVVIQQANQLVSVQKLVKR